MRESMLYKKQGVNEREKPCSIEWESKKQGELSHWKEKELSHWEKVWERKTMLYAL